VVSQEYYEPLSRYPISSTYVEALERLLPQAWVCQRHDVWIHASGRAAGGSAATLPTQGFKIHVSSTSRCALDTLEIVVPECVEHGIAFKIAADPGLLALLNSKLQGRGYAGKFMTIYPPDRDVFARFIERLYRRTQGAGLEGPYILSDRRYKDSKILFYRYGGFLPPRRLNVDGTETTFLVSPSGAYVPDERLPYFHLPEWVADPFVADPEVAPAGGTLLNDRYRVEGALHFSNAGGVYFGTDTATGRSIVVKEARPFTNCWSFGEHFWDAVQLLEHEGRVLRRLDGLSFIPRLIALFREWEHTFLVEDRVEGVSLDTYWAGEAVLVAPYIRRAGKIERFVPRFKQVAETLIDMVKAVHERGVVLGDLSPRNILVDVETLRMWFIDFESAGLIDLTAGMALYAAQWGTAGFMHPARGARDALVPEDDWYAVAMILYNAVVPVNFLFHLKPEAQALFLDRFIALGLPAEIKVVIEDLGRGDVTAAEATLAGWRVEGA